MQRENFINVETDFMNVASKFEYTDVWRANFINVEIDFINAKKKFDYCKI